ncbi:Receptor-like protein kinase 2 [Tetrabaena socialis]|uniref:Receptor-like protein kinase 2 n=1 Tax=Tetrabaena socialis TaxID=47790 RepID=A0A2J8A924_9CHLO|nr:Receptor-like protein kinase 2 [Tetrabaena socialis]|eukprot:PNH09019.1 Receptor-like protein kinase 2 [Tetrabaena socialis]
MAAVRRWLMTLMAAALLQHRASARTLERDVYALIAIHQEVHARDPQWAGAMDKWPVHTCAPNGTCTVDPCGLEWEGDGWEGVSCRYQWDWDKSIPRVVTNFHLPKRGLTGTLPKGLALLANITELDMDTNELAGPLPAEWGCLSNLIEIDFSNNRLTGTIPPELVELEVDGNVGLSGCVPDGCPPFQRLCGRFRGPPCPTFTTDTMIGTDVTGTRIRTRCAPLAVYALIAIHQEVRARDPQWAGAMDKWPIHTCAPNGTCAVDPCEWGCLSNLIEIDFSNNRLTGTIPPELVELELDGNPGLYGCVPDGCPPFDRLCGRRVGPPCPSFTTDVVIGTAVDGTRIRARCTPPQGGDQALQAGLRCPDITDFRQPITLEVPRRRRC